MLNSKIIRAMRPKSRRYQVTDSDGLALRIQTSGVKSWVLRVFQNGRIVDITLGHWPELSLMQARATARRKKKELELEPSGSYTVRDAFKFWCSKKRGRIISYRDEKLRLEKYVISKIGSRQLDTITPPILIKLMEPIEQAGKQSTVKRLLMRTREIFDIDGQGQVQATGTTPTAYCYLSFNASSSCGLYRDDVTTVQTASILGLFLIRSY